MPTCDFNKVALHISRTTFSKNTSGWLLLLPLHSSPNIMKRTVHSILNPEMYLELLKNICDGNFAAIVNGLNPFTIVTNLSVLEVYRDSGYRSKNFCK